MPKKFPPYLCNKNSIINTKTIRKITVPGLNIMLLLYSSEYLIKPPIPEGICIFSCAIFYCKVGKCKPRFVRFSITNEPSDIQLSVSMTCTSRVCRFIVPLYLLNWLNRPCHQGFLKIIVNQYKDVSFLCGCLEFLRLNFKRPIFSAWTFLPFTG